MNLLGLIIVLCWGDPDMPVCVEPPNGFQQMILRDRLQARLWGTPDQPSTCQNSLFSSCAPVMYDL